MATITTPACIVCGKTSVMEIDAVGYDRWQRRGMLIQDAFPEMPADEREQLKSGTHPACWESMFEEEEK